jgi:hypothetical protein
MMVLALVRLQHLLVLLLRCVHAFRGRLVHGFRCPCGIESCLHRRLVHGDRCDLAVDGLQDDVHFAMHVLYSSLYVILGRIRCEQFHIRGYISDGDEKYTCFMCEPDAVIVDEEVALIYEPQGRRPRHLRRIDDDAFFLGHCDNHT